MSHTNPIYRSNSESPKDYDENEEFEEVSEVLEDIEEDL